MQLTHLQRLEAESIHIMREVVANAENPVMLYSVGKDSATMLHLAKKAFYPAPPPFPLLHVDTTWKFREMYKLREKAAKDAGMELIVYHNPEAVEKGINPFDHGSLHTDMWKTEGLKQALTKYNFDVAFGGALYQDTLSTLRQRIQVHGDMRNVQQPNNASKIRALLLAGIRSARLWRQLGGHRWQLVFSRRKLLNELQSMLRN